MGLQRVGYNCATKQQQQTLYVCIYTLIRMYIYPYICVCVYIYIYIPFCCIYLLHKIIVGCVVETCHFVPARI